MSENYIPKVRDNSELFDKKEEMPDNVINLPINSTPEEPRKMPEFVEIKDKPDMLFSFMCPTCGGQLVNKPMPSNVGMDLYFVSAGKNAPALQKITPSYATGIGICLNCQIQFGYAAMFHISLPDRAMKLTDEQTVAIKEELTKPREQEAPQGATCECDSPEGCSGCTEPKTE